MDPTFKSMNGSLTRMIHSSRKVAQQLSFAAVDVKQTLHKIYSVLEDKDSDELLNYLPRNCSNITKLAFGFSIGNIKAAGVRAL